MAENTVSALTDKPFQTHHRHLRGWALEIRGRGDLLTQAGSVRLVRRRRWRDARPNGCANRSIGNLPCLHCGGLTTRKPKFSGANVCASDESAELLDVPDQNEVAAAIGSVPWNCLSQNWRSHPEQGVEYIRIKKGDRIQHAEPYLTRSGFLD